MRGVRPVLTPGTMVLGLVGVPAAVFMAGVLVMGHAGQSFWRKLMATAAMRYYGAFVFSLAIASGLLAFLGPVPTPVPVKPATSVELSPRSSAEIDAAVMELERRVQRLEQLQKE